MRRVRQARASIASLRERIIQCEHRKKHLQAHLQALKQQWQKGELTYAEYENFLNKDHSGKTIHQWFTHYDNYIAQCEEKIRSHEKTNFNSKIINSFIVLAIVAILAFSFINLPTILTGFAISENQNIFSQNINEVFQQSESRTISFDNQGQLLAAKVSGTIKGEGIVKIYLNEKLMYDSSLIQDKKTITGRSITGFAINEIGEVILDEQNQTEDTFNETQDKN